MVPDWQLPPGVDRGLWDYLQSREMVADYDAQMTGTPLAAADLAFCDKHFTSGRLLDLGCGTGRLCHHFARRDFVCVGVDLSEEMLAKARAAGSRVNWVRANIVELPELGTFSNVACLFSTLGIVSGAGHRRRVVENAFRCLEPGGVFVAHVHNRWFPTLGWRRFFTSEFPMPQAYGGAPLTIHHFTRKEVVGQFRKVGFAVKDIAAVGIRGERIRRFTNWRAYGFLIAARKP